MKREVGVSSLLLLLLLFSYSTLIFTEAYSLNDYQEVKANQTAPEDVEALKEIFGTLSQVDDNWARSLDWNRDKDPCASHTWGTFSCETDPQTHYYRVVGLMLVCVPSTSATNFPVALTNLTALQNFTSLFCSLSTFPDLTSMTSLKRFRVQNNYVNFTVPKLPEGIIYVNFEDNLGMKEPLLPQSVEYINLSDNPLITDVSSLFNKTTYPHLTTLFLQNIKNLNVSTLPHVGAHPTESVSNIQVLDMRGSTFNGSSGIYGPLSFLLGLSDLKTFNAGTSKISGPLPTYLPSNLTSLILTTNQHYGNLPEEWSQNIALETLDLSHNNLTGEIPESWESLVRMRRLDLRFNQLNGTIPEWLHKNNVTYFLSCNDWETLPEWCVDCGCGGPSGDGGDDGKRKYLWLLIIPAVFVLVGIVAAGYFAMRKRKSGYETLS